FANCLGGIFQQPRSNSSSSSELHESMVKKKATTAQSYCGLDIHKETEVATIIRGSEKKLVRKFEISLGGYGDLISWLKGNDCNDVVMEATGVLWIPTYEALTASGIKAVLANPEQVKANPGKKTDEKADE